MTGKVMSNECVLERDCEFPQVPAAQVAQPWQHTYVLMHRDGVSTGEDWFGAVGRFDYESGSLLQTDLGPGCYGSEPLHVNDQDGKGYLLVVVYNPADNLSELQIVEAETMGEPVCRLALPSVVPIGFHGTWQA
ncbi:MAG: carotenoid oxygenase family protein [Cyanobacteria bacterium J06559_1]